jgi:coenzyme F420-reducing hydrogenase beta subunit
MAIKEWNKECCGCGACADICPKSAISLRADDETFRYPVIDKEKCINCGLCEKTCPLSFSNYHGYDSVKSYVGTYKSKDVIYDSSSGGAFTAIYQVYTNKGYVVYGAQYEDHLRVVHGRAETEKECEKFRKSKYIQSDTLGCFIKVENDLKSGKSVLFSGVSCQCAALISYLDTKKVSKENLITVNILCHGVPSQAMFDKYIEEEEEEEAALVYQFRFKNKEAERSKVNSRTAWVEFSNGHKYIRTVDNDPFLRGYYKRLFYRPSCATCHFTCKERISDFTIADAWGIEKIKPEYRPIEGVSLILFNTEKAKDAFETINAEMDLEEVTSEWALASQRLFRAPTDMHKNRDKFFNLWKKMSFKKAVFKCTKPPMKLRLWRLIPESLRRQLKSLAKG